MRTFASTVAGVIGVISVLLMLGAIGTLFGNSSDAEMAVAFWRISAGLGGLASSAIIGTLVSILGVLEDRLPEPEEDA